MVETSRPSNLSQVLVKPIQGFLDELVARKIVAGVAEKIFFLVAARSQQLKEDLPRRFDRIHEKSLRQSSASMNRMEESIRVLGRRPLARNTRRSKETSAM